MIVRQAAIPMPDGVDLAATLYLPDDADTAPVPAVLEYLPYRKDDAMLARDHGLRCDGLVIRERTWERRFPRGPW